MMVGGWIRWIRSVLVVLYSFYLFSKIAPTYMSEFELLYLHSFYHIHSLAWVPLQLGPLWLCTASSPSSTPQRMLQSHSSWSVKMTSSGVFSPSFWCGCHFAADSSYPHWYFLSRVSQEQKEMPGRIGNRSWSKPFFRLHSFVYFKAFTVQYCWRNWRRKNRQATGICVCESKKRKCWEEPLRMKLCLGMQLWCRASTNGSFMDFPNPLSSSLLSGSASLIWTTNPRKSCRLFSVCPSWWASWSSPFCYLAFWTSCLSCSHSRCFYLPSSTASFHWVTSAQTAAPQSTFGRRITPDGQPSHWSQCLTPSSSKSVHLLSMSSVQSGKDTVFQPQKNLKRLSFTCRLYSRWETCTMLSCFSEWDLDWKTSKIQTGGEWRRSKRRQDMLVCTSLLRNLVLEWYKIIVARCQCPCSLFIYVSLIVITCKNCVFTAGVQNCIKS